MTDVVVLYTTWPDGETAAAAARAAVEQGLAACVNVLAPLQATYRWRGVVETADEVPVLFKTRADAAAGLRDWIAARHPFETPAILSFTAGAASLPAYLAWVVEAVAPGDASRAPQPAAIAALATTEGPAR